MKRFLNRSLVAALMLGASVVAIQADAQQGQERRPAKAGEQRGQREKLTIDQRIDRRVDRMKSNLNLTDAQAAQIRAILKEDAARLQAHREAIKNATTKEAKQAAREQFVVDMKTSRERVGAVLTADQRAKVESKIGARREKMNELREKQGAERKELRRELRKEMKQENKLQKNTKK